MKKCFVILLAVLCALSFTGCRRDLNYVIGHEPSLSGVVTETSDHSVLIENDSGAYWVSLEVEYADSMTHFSVGDAVTVYYDGNIAESYPMQINRVYAILLTEPADRSENNKS